MLDESVEKFQGASGGACINARKVIKKSNPSAIVVDVENRGPHSNMLQMERSFSKKQIWSAV
jgi:hypothetical protein